MNKKLTYRQLEALLNAMPEDQKDTPIEIFRTEAPQIFLTREVLQENLYIEPGENGIVQESDVRNLDVYEEEEQAEILEKGPFKRVGDLILYEWEESEISK